MYELAYLSISDSTHKMACYYFLSALIPVWPQLSFRNTYEQPYNLLKGKKLLKAEGKFVLKRLSPIKDNGKVRYAPQTTKHASLYRESDLFRFVRYAPPSLQVRYAHPPPLTEHLPLHSNSLCKSMARALEDCK